MFGNIIQKQKTDQIDAIHEIQMDIGIAKNDGELGEPRGDPSAPSSAAEARDPAAGFDRAGPDSPQHYRERPQLYAMRFAFDRA